MTTVAVYALREALRRRVFVVVLVLSAVFLGLYWLAVDTAFGSIDAGDEGVGGVDIQVVAGATLFGMAMFGTLFLGTILAVFLTLGAVRGDAERGLLQPLVVRPLGRARLLAGRFVGAVAVTVPYVLVLYGATMAITAVEGGWTADRLVRPGLQLAGAVLVLAALSLLGSIVLASMANGIAVFMIFGAGLVAALVGQIGEAINSATLERVSDRTAWVLPFEGLYQDALYRITADTYGATRFVLSLGPFGGANPAGTGFFIWTAAYLLLVGAAAVLAFHRRDL